MTESEIRAAIEKVMNAPDFQGPLYGTGKQQARNSRGDDAFDALMAAIEADIAAAGDSTRAGIVAAG